MAGGDLKILRLSIGSRGGGEVANWHYLRICVKQVFQSALSEAEAIGISGYCISHLGS